MKLTISQRISVCVAAWTLALALAGVITIAKGGLVVQPWLLIALSVAVTSSISLMLWRVEADLHRDISEGSQHDADVLHISQTD